MARMRQFMAKEPTLLKMLLTATGTQHIVESAICFWPMFLWDNMSKGTVQCRDLRRNQGRRRRGNTISTILPWIPLTTHQSSLYTTKRSATLRFLSCTRKRTNLLIGKTITKVAHLVERLLTETRSSEEHPTQVPVQEGVLQKHPLRRLLRKNQHVSFSNKGQRGLGLVISVVIVSTCYKQCGYKLELSY